MRVVECLCRMRGKEEHCNSTGNGRIPGRGFILSVVTHAKKKIAGRAMLLSLKCLDPGGGRKIPAKWHGASAYPSVLVPETYPSTNNGMILLPAILILMCDWLHRSWHKVPSKVWQSGRTTNHGGEMPQF